MGKVLLVVSILLLASAAVAFVHQHRASPVSARQALVKQATQGSADAQYKLGALYVLGEEEPRNDSEAAQWFRKAAEQGHVDAQSALALMYSGGLGVPRSKVFAYQWAAISLANPTLDPNDRSDVQEMLAMLTGELAPSEIVEAERRAKHWQATAGNSSQLTQ